MKSGFSVPVSSAPGAGLPGLESARALRGMSRAALAHRLGLPEARIGRWESGEATPPVLVAMAVAEVVGVGVEHLRRLPSSR